MRARAGEEHAESFSSHQASKACEEEGARVRPRGGKRRATWTAAANQHQHWQLKQQFTAAADAAHVRPCGGSGAPPGPGSWGYRSRKSPAGGMRVRRLVGRGVTGRHSADLSAGVPRVLTASRPSRDCRFQAPQRTACYAHARFPRARPPAACAGRHTHHLAAGGVKLLARVGAGDADRAADLAARIALQLRAHIQQSVAAVQQGLEATRTQRQWWDAASSQL